MNNTDIMGVRKISNLISDNYTNCMYVGNIIWRELGFPVLYGYLIDENGEERTHYLNLCQESDELVDLTAHQFDRSLLKIFIIPKDSEEARKRYESLLLYR